MYQTAVRSVIRGFQNRRKNNSPISDYYSEYTMQMNITGNTAQNEQEDTITNNSNNGDIIN